MTTLRDRIQQHNMLPGKGLVLCAVSGGADSMCLLHVLNSMSSSGGFHIAAIHFEHGIRGSESLRDADFVCQYCSDNNIPFYIGHGDTIAYSKEHSLGLEEAARILRYQFFDEIYLQTGAITIATAHNADDNVETVLMNMVRGSGEIGLAGIPSIRGHFIRPLLTTTRKEIEEYLQNNNIPHIEDSTNTDTQYTRNKIRHKVIPVLKEINPSLCETVAQESALLRIDSEYLDKIAIEFLKTQENDKLSIDDLFSLHQSIQLRVLRKFSNCDLTFSQTMRLLDLCRSNNPSFEMNLLGHISVHREYGFLVMGRITKPTFRPFELKIGESVVCSELNLNFSAYKTEKNEKTHNELNTFCFNCDKIYGTFLIRPRQIGDKINLGGHQSSKTLKKLFIEKKIPINKRDCIPIITVNNEICAVHTIGVDKKYRANADNDVIIIEIKEI